MKKKSQRWRRQYRFSAVSSTNDVAKLLAEQGAPDGTVVIAEKQTFGRGQFHRHWYSPKKTGIYFSIIRRPAHNGNVAVAPWRAAGIVRELFQNETGLTIHVKKPNDLVLNGRKLGGILVEGRTAGRIVRFVVVGVGVNINIKRFPGLLKDSAVSLYQVLGRPLSIRRLTQSLLKEFRSDKVFAGS